MSISYRVLADSTAPCGKRLITGLARYPRAIHSEIMTHRALSKSSASSRAIPVEGLIRRIEDDPWIPSYIGAAQKGMQAGEELRDEVRSVIVAEWLRAKDNAIESARQMLRLGAPKQVVNRILEPWMFIEVIISGTEWNNLFSLRDHEMAEPHFQHLARLMKTAHAESVSKRLPAGAWHLPFIGVDVDDDNAIADFVSRWAEAMNVTYSEAFEKAVPRIAVGRCARVSYLNHEGRRAIADDLALCDRLCVQSPLHAAPGEHVAYALSTLKPSGNFYGFEQFRKTLPNETVWG